MAADSAEPVPVAPKPVRGPRRHVARRTPSSGGYVGLGAGGLFAADDARAAALRRGTEVHAAYERVEWLDAAEVKTDFDRAFVKPPDAVELWREKPYELFRDGMWESGQFDRVVFSERDGRRTAVVYDFKTNARRDDETPESFATRMRETYAGQMRAYRRALSLLTGIPPADIALRLLLAKTRACIDVE